MNAFQLRLIRTYKNMKLLFNQAKTKTILKRVLIAMLLTGFFAFGLVFGFISSLTKDDPIRSNETIIKAIEDNKNNGFVYFSDQSEVGELLTGEDRSVIALKDIPPQIIDATLAIEDKSFYTHNGIDFTSTLRAIKQQVSKDDTQTGGSTITQQLARRVFLSLDQTYERKAAEILLALRMERVLSKDQILLAYLTKIYYGKGSDGNNLYGVKSAAKSIFDVDDLHKLNIAQAAYLAGLPQQPNTFSAFDSNGALNAAGLQEALKRQKLVLQKMLEQAKITPAEFNSATHYDIKGSLAKTKAKEDIAHPFLMMETERRATEILLNIDHPNVAKNDPNYQKWRDEAKDNLLNKGYKIYTTINPTIYNAMNKINDNNANYTAADPEKGLEQVGAIMINNRTGAILGMIEGRDFKVEQLNHATQMVRQPGSAMKPIAAYLPALEAGLIQPASIIDDVPIVLKSSGGDNFIPENWDGKFHGLITAREALKWSYNIPALKLFNDKVGIEKAWDFAKKVGITTLTAQDYQAKTGVIGGLTQGVSVEELTNAYAAIGNQGTYNKSYLISRIVSATGQIVYEHPIAAKTVFSKQTAYLMTDMMKSVVDSGTAADMKDYFQNYSKVPFVGKTGSTQNDADAWFVGYTPDVSLGVWAGYDQPKYKLTTTHCSESAGCGTTRAKKIWSLVMDASIKQQQSLFPSKEFVMPENIVTKTVSKYSGKLPTAEIQARGDVNTDLFNLKYVPSETDSVASMSRIIAFKGSNYIANPATPADMVTEKFTVRREKSISAIIDEIKTGMKRVPEDQRKPISHFYPIDAALDGPTEVDPRQDDGKIPSAPRGLSMTGTKEAITLTFQMNNEPDVVGYRIYGSNDGKTFALIQGKAVSSQAEAQFTVTGAARDLYMFVLTAVDVAGHESEKSDIKFNNRKSIESWFLHFFN